MTQTNATPAIEAGQSIVIGGEIFQIVAIKGRWVNISDGTNISRALAADGRSQYLQDVQTLGAEINDPNGDLADLIQAVKDEAAESETADATGYTGPMLKLRERLKAGKYQKAANGQPCCGDLIATIFGTLKPEDTIRACVIALGIGHNPYTHLNIGQQSMNLRNRVRNAYKRGEFGFGVIREAVEEVTGVESDVFEDTETDEDDSEE